MRFNLEKCAPIKIGKTEENFFSETTLNQRLHKKTRVLLELKEFLPINRAYAKAINVIF